MARRPRPKPPAAKAVFINCPFDDEFKPLLRSMVFAIIASGYYPRCALDETDGAEVRVSKIAAMIGECDWGIHDLSRVEVGAAGLPRFNMPMELGLHLGARLLGEARHRRKRALILDAERHRYDAILSDISGQDIEAHGSAGSGDPMCPQLALRASLTQRVASPGRCRYSGRLSALSGRGGRAARSASPRSKRPDPQRFPLGGQ
jgi:hypothetical protein